MTDRRWNGSPEFPIDNDAPPYVFCGEILPNPFPANWSSYCKSEKNNFATDAAGNKLHTYHARPAAPVAVPASPRQDLQAHADSEIRLIAKEAAKKIRRLKPGATDDQQEDWSIIEDAIKLGRRSK